MMKNNESPITIPKIMVFRPTLEEMKDFSKYLEYMESQGAHHAGLAKIIPPPEWIPRKAGYDNINVQIRCPIKQVVSGSQGYYQQFNISSRSMSFRDFKKLANSPDYRTPDFFDYDDLERKYWKNITYNSAIYGADVPGSLTDSTCKEFNINNLNTILDLINDSYGIKIMGVNTAYLYFGMWKSSFAWHTEDMDLYSINYLHFGAPKSWYCVPPEHGKKLEKLAIELFSPQYLECPAFLRHKMTIISPQILRKYSVPYSKITQEKGEIMITFPYSYHAGYNHGLNCAESTNFALPRWIEFGKRATICHCRPDTVKINMDVFVQLFQPERYDNWLKGIDIGPDPKDPTNICAAPSPYYQEIEPTNKIKPKRQPSYKRQLIQKNLQLVEEEEYCPEDFECEDDDDSPDYCSNENRNGEKNYKSKRKKSKCSNNIDFNKNDINLSNNNTTKINGCDLKSNGTVTTVLNNGNICKNELLTYEMDNFNCNEAIVSLDQLCRRTIQYTDNPCAFEDEKNLNHIASLIDPFCSICTLLRLFEFPHQDLSRISTNLKPPLYSRVLIPKSLFNFKMKHQSTNVINNNNDDDNTDLLSTLLICSTCKLCVHSSCYGVELVPDNPREWLCDRCISGDLDAACCLCPLRGGPIKQTKCKQWAHLTCSLAITNVKFDDHIVWKPIDISLTCCFCSQKSNGSISNYIMGLCIRCSNSQCTEYFHVTCAHREGVLFELNDNLTSFRFICKKCQMNKFYRNPSINNNHTHHNSTNNLNNHYHQQQQQQQQNDENIELNMMVVARYSPNCYSYARVLECFDEMMHHVQFVDNTLNNIRSTDIVDFEKKCPMIGDLVEVIRNKEQLYGTYAGYHITKMYSLEFSNGVKSSYERDNIYKLIDEIPKRILVRINDNPD
uniref:[histone H3]-trimethyl-L-lysine(9) demethylase n=1 Tax=Psoroptes ovis TaxID=83912 RepID=A0A3B0RF76_PSOOV|nr:probable lysine-specific demethylase 4A [Psoroptes ovis]